MTVKNPGTYYYFIRLEKVDKKSAVEDLGIASNKAEAKVGDIKNSKAVSKVKVSTNVYAIPSSQPSVQPMIEVDVFADIYTKEADEKYTITAQQKGGEKYTGTYVLSQAEKERVFANGVIEDVWLEGDVDWENNKVPKFEGNGKKITVSVQSTVMKKAKKGTATPKAITEKTQPVILVCETAWRRYDYSGMDRRGRGS